MNHTYDVPDDATEDERRAAEIEYIMYAAKRDEGRLQELSDIHKVSEIIRPKGAEGPGFIEDPVAIKMLGFCNVSGSCEAFPCFGCSGAGASTSGVPGTDSHPTMSPS